MRKFKVTITRTTVNESEFIVYAENDVDAYNIAEENMEGDCAVVLSESNTKNSWVAEDLGEARSSQFDKKEKKEKK